MSKCPCWEAASAALGLLQAEAEGFLQLRHQFSPAARGVFPLRRSEGFLLQKSYGHVISSSLETYMS